MNNRHFILFITLFVSFLLSSCFPEEDNWQEMGLAPTYISPDDFSYIKSGPPILSEDQGSFLEVGDRIYINEKFRGIHVFDNTDPGNVKKIYFWTIPGNTEFTVEGNYLYADNSRHLITIDISDPENLKVLSHIADVYSVNLENDNYPKNYEGTFECADFERGIVNGWEMKLLNNPKCFIFN